MESEDIKGGEPHAPFFVHTHTGHRGGRYVEEGIRREGGDTALAWPNLNISPVTHKR